MANNAKFHWESECVWKENECQKRPNQRKFGRVCTWEWALEVVFIQLQKKYGFSITYSIIFPFFGDGGGVWMTSNGPLWNVTFSCFSECHINTFFIEYIAQQFYKVPKNFDNAIFASIFLHYFIYFFVFSSCHSFSKFEIIPKWTRKTISREVNTFKWKASHLYLSHFAWKYSWELMLIRRLAEMVWIKDEHIIQWYMADACELWTRISFDRTYQFRANHIMLLLFVKAFTTNGKYTQNTEWATVWSVTNTHLSFLCMGIKPNKLPACAVFFSIIVSKLFSWIILWYMDLLLIDDDSPASILRFSWQFHSCSCCFNLINIHCNSRDILYNFIRFFFI